MNVNGNTIFICIPENTGYDMKPKVIVIVGGEASELAKPMQAVQIVAEIIAENWDLQTDETITITIT